MPIWGPVSIFIATNGLQGRWKFCVAASMGSGIVDVAVCFIVILGFAKVMDIISPFIPFLFVCGALVLFLTGMRIIKTKIDLYQTGTIKKRAIIKNMNGFGAGFLINTSNPSILFGWLSASFLAISFAASLGLNVGGFDRSTGASIQTFKNFSMHFQSSNSNARETLALKASPTSSVPTGKKEIPGHMPFLAVTGYAFSVGLGTVLWFSSFSYVLSRYRSRFPVKVLRRIIQGLGVMLCVLALYFLFRGAILLIGPLFSK